MKFLCVECDQQMAFDQKEAPGDGTLAVIFRCPACGRRIGMLNNPAEAQLVSSLGVAIGHENVAPAPFGVMERFLDDGLVGGSRPSGGLADGPVDQVDASRASPLRPEWDETARSRLQAVPNFVRGMVMKIYTNYAAEHGIQVITPAVMDRARSELGLEGM